MKNKVIIGGRYQYSPIEVLKESGLFKEYRAYDKVTKKELLLQIHQNEDPYIEKLRDVKHAFLQGVFDVVPLDEDGKVAFLLESGRICSLNEAIKKNIYLQQRDALVILKFLILAVKALHQKMIPSGRICLQNVLMWNYSLIRIGNQLYPGQLPLHSQAPQVLDGKRATYASDVFSLGVIFYRMVYGCYPFEGEEEDDLVSSIKKKKFKNVTTVSPLDIWISKEAHYLLISMLDYYPENRPSIDSLLDTSSLSFYVQTEMQLYVKPKGVIIPEPFLKKYSVILPSKTTIKYDEYYEETVYLVFNNKSFQFMSLYSPEIKANETEPRRYQSYFEKLRAIKESYVPETCQFLCRVEDYEKFRRQSMIVTQYCNQGDLYSYLENKKQTKTWLSEKQIYIFMYLLALSYKQMRDLGVTSIHTVHSKRIMIHNRNIKLREPGLLSPSVQKKLLLSQNIDYFAPELKEKSDFVELDQSDIWSYGILFYYLLEKKLPKITEDDPHIHIEDIDTNRKNRNLIGKCLDQNVHTRIKLEQIKIDGVNQSLLEEMLNQKPEQEVQQPQDDSQIDHNDAKYKQKHVLFKSRKTVWCKNYNKVICESSTSGCRIWIKIICTWILAWFVFFGLFFVNGGLGMLRTNYYRKIPIEVPKNYGTQLYTLTILSTDGGTIESEYSNYSYEEFMLDLKCMENTYSPDAEGEVYDFINVTQSILCLFGFVYAILFCIVYAIFTHKLDLPTLLVKRKKSKDNKQLYHHIIVSFILPSLLFCFFYIFAFEYIIQMVPCLGIEDLNYPSFTSIKTLLNMQVGTYFQLVFPTVILWAFLMFLFLFLSLATKTVGNKVYQWKVIIPTFVIMLVYTVVCRVGFGSQTPLEPTWTYNLNMDIVGKFYGFFGFFPEAFYLIIYVMERLVDVLFWFFLRLGMEPSGDPDIQKIEIKAKFDVSEDYDNLNKISQSNEKLPKMMADDFEIFD